MHEITIEYAQYAAQRQLDRFKDKVKVKSTPLLTLGAFPWHDLIYSDRKDIRLDVLDLELDPRGSLGRTALCLAMVARFHSASKAEFWEITHDWFRFKLLSQWRAVYRPTGKMPPPDWVDEFLSYEEPHAAVAVDGGQFDPLSTVSASDSEEVGICHSGVLRFPAWPGVASAMMVSRSLHTNDPFESIEMLNEADKICPLTCYADQARLKPLIALNRLDEAREIIASLIEKRPSARVFYILEELYGEHHPKCYSIYGELLWGILRKRLESEMALE